MKAATKGDAKQVLVTQADIAAMTGVSTEKILRWVKARMGGVPAPVRVIGRTYLFNRREVMDWLRVRPQDGPPPG